MILGAHLDTFPLSTGDLRDTSHVLTVDTGLKPWQGFETGEAGWLLGWRQTRLRLRSAAIR